MNIVEIIHDSDQMNQLQIQVSFDIQLEVKGHGESKHFVLNINSEDSVSQLIKLFEESFNVLRSRIKRKYGMSEVGESSESSASEPPFIEIKKNDEILSVDLEIKKFLELVAKNDNSLKLRINDEFYDFQYNYPFVDRISLPIHVMVDFPMFPRTLNIKFGKPEDADYRWVDKHNHILKEGYYYIPTENDAYTKIKLICTPRNNGLVGKERSVVTKSYVVESSRTFPFYARHERTKIKLRERKIRILSYNILAEKYTWTSRGNKILYPYCEEKYINGEYRNSVLIREILGYNADLISLQEVDVSTYKLCYGMILSREGFDGRHVPKIGNANEGVAAFYRKDRFELLETFDCSLGKYIADQSYMDDIVEELKKVPALFSKVLEHNTVAMALVLKQTDVKNKIIVFVNTHLYYHVDAVIIKFIQSFLALKFIQHVIHETASKNPNAKIAVVFGGDFNSVPTSPVYCYYTAVNAQVKTKVLKEFPDLQGEKWIDTRFLFKSACGTPEYTNFVGQFNGCLDYIFYEKDKMKVDEIIPFPSHEEVTRNTALPSRFFPSDHLALVVNLSWIV